MGSTQSDSSLAIWTFCRIIPSGRAPQSWSADDSTDGGIIMPKKTARTKNPIKTVLDTGPEIVAGFSPSYVCMESALHIWGFNHKFTTSRARMELALAATAKVHLPRLACQNCSYRAVIFSAIHVQSNPVVSQPAAEPFAEFLSYQYLSLSKASDNKKELSCNSTDHQNGNISFSNPGTF